VQDALVEAWRARVERARRRLGWDGMSLPSPVVARVHASGASLALAAPLDQLFTATEVNEWALCAALYERDPLHWSALQEALAAAGTETAAAVAGAPPPVLEESAALERFMHLAESEARPGLRALLDAAEARELPWLLDDSIATFGAGAGARSYPLHELPSVADVPWASLHDVPIAAVTGSNGKTTTVRLIAACTRAQGWRDGYNCTDGVFVGEDVLGEGDYSGPAGARKVLRDPRVEAAVLEVARGGILRRGLAVARAAAAVVTNVSADHFGEYGIHDLEALADVKLTVASLVGPRGLLVLNADDAVLRAKAPRLGARLGRSPPLGWFALDDEHETLVAHRRAGGATCGVADGRLVLSSGGLRHDLGAIAEMPLAVAGSAGYNVSNLGAAALAASALGAAPAPIAGVFARFGVDPADNLGRLMRYEFGGVNVLVDYAHNPDGLRGILSVARHLRDGPAGRIALLLGHAGNREDADIEQLAAVAAEFGPDLVVVKEIEGYLRGRAVGEVPRILRDALLRHGMPESSLALRMNEVDAARCALEWARPGDVLVLLVHSLAARRAVLGMLQQRGRR
jgi:UDP-N-acetylmuramyl tripeptide synthase